MIGVIAILATLFIEFWLATVGLMITTYDYQMNKSPTAFLSFGIGVILGLVPGIAGVGFLKRQRWSRWALMLFWLIVSLYIVVLILLNLEDAAYNFNEWLGEVIFWLCIAVVGFLQAIILNSSKVKDLFKKRA